MIQPSRRRGRKPSLVHRQYFHDALLFLGFSVEARDSGGTALEHWRQLAALPARPMPEREESRGPKRKRKRSRRGRRGKRKPRSEDGGNGGNGGGGEGKSKAQASASES